MPLSSSSSLLLFFFLTTTQFHSLSHGSPNVHDQRRHHHHQQHLRTAVRQSTSASTNGGVVTVELWCVAKNNAEDSALQSALDWACGPGGSNCGTIQQGGPCYDPADIQRTASFAFNDYFLKHGMTEDSCNFDGTAALTSLNPTYGGCKFPSSLTVNNGSFTASSTTGGVGPASADISGGNYNAARWCQAFITIHLLYVITLIF